MPTKPLKACRTQGCPALTDTTYCPAHKKQAQASADERRGSANDRGYDYRWSQFRTRYLKHHPLCILCQAEGQVTLATLVDHIIPMALGGAKYDEHNLEPLCSRHHGAKTMKEAVRQC